MGGGVEGGGRCRYQSVVHNAVHARLTWQDTLWRIFPAGAAASFDIGLSNASLATNMHINLYTIGKSTVVCFVLLFAIVFRILRWPSRTPRLRRCNRRAPTQADSSALCGGAAGGGGGRHLSA